MDKLSPEIINLVLDQLKENPWDRPKLAAYATISRKWQAVVESRTFREKEILNTDLGRLAAVFTAAGTRAAALRRLWLRINVPAYAGTPEDRAKNQQAFRHSVKTLLGLLAGWNSSGQAELALALWPGRVCKEAESLVTEPINVEDVDSGASRRFLRFSEADVREFPAISCVREFSNSTIRDCAFYPRSLCQLAATFIHLEVLDLEHWDPAVKYHALRKEHRRDFAEGLRSLRGKLPGLRRLSIKRNGALPPSNHSFVCQSFEEDGVDPLCEAVRLLAQPTVRELSLTAVEISRSLFGPGTWEALRELKLQPHPVAASGEWLLTGDEDAAPEPEPPSPVEDRPPWEVSNNESDEEEEDEEAPALADDDDGDRDKDAVENGESPSRQWRTNPDDKTLVPLIRDLTAAVCGSERGRTMPALQAATLLVRHDDGFVAVKCAEAGSPFAGEVEPASATKARRWVVQALRESEWDVPEDLADAWRGWVGETGEVALS